MTYLAGLAVVPCFICRAPINRRGKGGQGHRKYCSVECRREADKRLNVGRNPDKICTRCNERPKHTRPDGRLRSYCKPCEVQQKAEYQRTEAGKATWQRYYRKTYSKIHPPVPCTICHRPTKNKNAAPGRSTFCSDTCREEGQRRVADRKAAKRRAARTSRG